MNTLRDLLEFFESHYSELKFKKDDQTNIWAPTENFNPMSFKDNQLKFCIDYLKTINMISNTHFLGIDYGIFPLVLNGCSFSDIYNNMNLIKLYNNNTEKNLKWLQIDIEALNKTKEIKYIIISDSLIEKNKNLRAQLKKSLFWEEVFFIPRSKNYLSIILLKRI